MTLQSLSRVFYQMALYLCTVLLSAKCPSCRWTPPHRQRLAHVQPSVSCASMLNTRVDTILRLGKTTFFFFFKKPEGKTQIPRKNLCRGMLKCWARPTQARRAVFSGAECSVALTRGEVKVAEIDDSLRAVHTLTTDATAALP